jgi:hypothetical protein
VISGPGAKLSTGFFAAGYLKELQRKENATELKLYIRDSYPMSNQSISDA